MNLIDAGLFINFPRDPGQNIYFKVFDGQDIYLKKTDTPPPLQNQLFVPKKWDQFQPFHNSTDCHTKHIAMPHGLWPSSDYGLSFSDYGLKMLKERRDVPFSSSPRDENVRQCVALGHKVKLSFFTLCS